MNVWNQNQTQTSEYRLHTVNITAHNGTVNISEHSGTVNIPAYRGTVNISAYSGTVIIPAYILLTWNVYICV